MGASYGQFCPVAKAMELLDERWTLLVIRELIAGSRRFNDLRRGLPRMSPTLLSRRLQQLAAAGLVERTPTGAEVEYALTPAGKELEPIVRALGVWGTRWIPEIGDPDLDPKLLLWDMHRRVDHRTVPERRTVLRFSFPEAARPVRDWWLVITPDEADVCDADPGHEVDVLVTADLRCLTDVWRGARSWESALRSGEVRLDGREALRRAVPAWFQLMSFAAVPRPGVS
ncbi:DNA-binding HxlR family transcriptional regulator [Actinoplanes octamycinicus]|uniref:DNA-binding HxlR family transcriptional regulator n=1 Tax=Actinoplanes octamycinicus TaxID=135948 RepID=A0A7W7H7T6_9ACTN|nr:helix-turn-helix domain-containing protein [Actinoplanes octamycinicus]MBB4745422.1 DNA-binding HxlR family transcriptional regulator [Actinoplanes octamycinicus]GIE56265.1 HxlR family transcriptional regulator [Actinoplanes octamycinicus]